MSQRTANASKAIKLAWEQEQQRVLQGEGTRDWTDKQQQDIIDKGKAYDEHGKAFEGQHMQSVSQHPEFQGDPDNIQFLTHEEHFEAHKENWQNPTNWYYDPIAKEYHDFGEGKYIPCEVIKLSSPICIPISDSMDESNDSYEGKSVGDNDDASVADTSMKNDKSENNPVITQDAVKNTNPTTKERESLFDKAIDGLLNFESKHPKIYSVGKKGIKIFAKTAYSVGMSTMQGALLRKSGINSFDPMTALKTSKKIKAVETTTSVNVEDIEKGTRASPIEHSVSGHPRNVNGKVINVKPYKRGGKK